MPRQTRNIEQLIGLLKSKAQADRRTGMARFGIEVDAALGVSMPEIRTIGATTVQDHELAQELWQSGIHEARILASLIDKPQWVTRDQCDIWSKDFNSWDVVDQVCGNLFDKTPFVFELVHQWSEREEEFVKRAAFTLIAWSAVHLKKRPDDDFLALLPLIKREAHDGRNFVKKATNWALRQIGKRSAALHAPALELANELAASDDASQRWVGLDAAKELNIEKIRLRLGL